MKWFSWFRAFGAATLLAGSTWVSAQVAGVSAQEVVFGSILDVSGPAVLLGAPTRDGMLLRFEDQNAKGGVHGRRLKLVVEDSGYDPKKGVIAAQKLIQHDGVFGFLANLGTPIVMATLPIITDAGRFHLFPFSPHQATYEPLNPYTFQLFAPYQDYMNAGVRAMEQLKNAKRVGLLYQDDDYGLEVKRGVEAGLSSQKLALVESVSYKRGTTDFSSQIARLKAADCDLVVLATLVRETVGAMSEARKVGWGVDMLVTASGYSAQTHELGGASVEGLYGVSVMPHPYAEGANPELAGWIKRYRARFGMDPNVWGVMGYVLADLAIQGLEKAGPDLTPAAYTRAMESLETKGDMFGGPGYRFSATDHLGNRRGRLAQIQQGKWVLISDYLK